MKNRILVCLAFVLILVPVITFSQNSTTKNGIFHPLELVEKPKGFLDHLLDPSRFSMTHSYSLSLFSSGKQAFNQGLYLNTMDFRVSDPLFFQVRVGYFHQPFGGPGMGKNNGGNLFLQRAMVRYKPSENVIFSIDYQSYPTMMASPYGSAW